MGQTMRGAIQSSFDTQLTVPFLTTPAMFNSGHKEAVQIKSSRFHFVSNGPCMMEFDTRISTQRARITYSPGQTAVIVVVRIGNTEAFRTIQDV